MSETALLAVVEAAEPLVGPWRARYDETAPLGVPAHVSVLVPFLDAERIDAQVSADLAGIIAGYRSFTVRFTECRRFPEVVYLAPTPDEPFRALTESLVARWPECPPYGGQFAEIIPHLTVAHGQPAEVLDQVDAAVSASLPVTAVVSAVSLFVNDDGRWCRTIDFPLAT